MKKPLLVALLASPALLLAGALSAQTTSTPTPTPSDSPAHRPMGDMTRDKVEDFAEQMFVRLDVNKDGKIDQGDREAQRRVVFDRIDSDGNGTISFAEFSVRPEREGMRGERGGERGEGFGRGHRGHGERGMRRGGGRHGGGMGGGHALRDADANGDGAVTLVEIKTAALARFDKADTNGDGKVTAEERRAARPSGLPRGPQAGSTS